MQELASGNIRKMHTELSSPVQYTLPIGDQLIDMNALIGQQIGLSYQGQINCVHCGRLSKKSFSQGHCYPCMKKLASCDTCIMSPEKCHFHAGTCREPKWGEPNCMIDHYVYLANSSGLKVGITRYSQIPSRWMDQGAIQALPIFKVSTRQLSGFVEVLLKQFAADKTNWRKMLKNEVDSLDLAAERDRLFSAIDTGLNQLRDANGEQSVTALDSEESISIDYPVIDYPLKVSSFNLDKAADVSGKLMGIKGQYLILDGGVINMRKYSGYHLTLSA